MQLKHADMFANQKCVCVKTHRTSLLVCGLITEAAYTACFEKNHDRAALIAGSCAARSRFYFPRGVLYSGCSIRSKTTTALARRPTVSNSPVQFDNVSVLCKANVYFDGKVVSHTVLFSGGKKKTLGLIYPGSFKFNTDAAERMEITAGECRAKLAGKSEWTTYPAGTHFDVPSKSSFEIAVDNGQAQYVCSFL
jgi:uncharacterized protein YaiE (UPF0345 family)